MKKTFRTRTELARFIQKKIKPTYSDYGNFTRKGNKQIYCDTPLPVDQIEKAIEEEGCAYFNTDEMTFSFTYFKGWEVEIKK